MPPVGKPNKVQLVNSNGKKGVLLDKNSKELFIYIYKAALTCTLLRCRFSLYMWLNHVL